VVTDDADKNTNNNDVYKQNDSNHNDNDKNNTNINKVAWDKARTARFGFLGACLVAPCIHFWYRALAAQIPGTNMAAVVQRVFIDQFIYTPLFLPVWLTSLWTLEGHECMKDFSSATGRIQATMPTVMVANWTLWIPAQSFNFAMIPLRYQVLYSNVVSLLWNVYLSHSQTSKTPGKVMDELDEVVPT
jgi:peroxisomal membrane protein 2